MRYPDLFTLTEAQRRAEQFEHEVEHAHLLAQAPKEKSWRYRAAELLLKSAERLEPRRTPETARSTC